MSVWDTVKLYASEWVETKCRKFTPQECAAVIKATVVPSKFGKSVCFLFSNGKRFIPLEPTAPVEVNDVLKMENLELINLNYVGTKESLIGAQVPRIRVHAEVEPPVITFDNPFGL